MAIEIQRNRSNWFYGRLTLNGRKKSYNLGVKIEGRIPDRMEDEGDAAFERSRARAQMAFEKLERDLKQKGKNEELLQQIFESRTGSRVSSVSLQDITTKWQAVRRKRPLSEQYQSQGAAEIGKFLAYLAENHPNAKDMADVQNNMCTAFMNSEDDRGVTSKTSNNTLVLLRSIFKTLQKQAGMPENPFAGIPTKDEDTIHRKPFSSFELNLIIEASKKDPFTHKLVVIGACTALRRGDCCLLLRDAVDLKNDYIKVKTMKTGEFAEIPIFSALREIILAEPKSDSKYMFPDLAQKYLTNPDYVTSKFQKVLEYVGFSDSNDRQVESDFGPLHQSRKTGLRRASLRDFHSLRVSWVTISLTNGIPIEIVRRVTGHKTVEIVLKHYFQPNRSDFRKILGDKLPRSIGGEDKSKKIDLDEIQLKLQQMTPENWQLIRDQLLAATK